MEPGEIFKQTQVQTRSNMEGFEISTTPFNHEKLDQMEINQLNHASTSTSPIKPTPSNATAANTLPLANNTLNIPRESNVDELQSSPTPPLTSEFLEKNSQRLDEAQTAKNSIPPSAKLVVSSFRLSGLDRIDDHRY